MKKSVSIIVALALLFGMCLTPVALANADSKTVKVLTPEKDSYIILDKVELTKDNGRISVNIKGHKKVDGIANAFRLIINEEKGTYKTTKRLVPLSARETQLRAATTYYYAWVQAITDDLPGLDLCWTKLRLDWADYGTTVGFSSHSLSTWAANPSPLGTHWYVGDTILFDAQSYDSNQKLRQQGYAEFYNWDWGYDNLRTDVSHFITITANNNATYDWGVTWDRSGEDASLLDLDVVTS